jgi:hypothetical protein
MDSIALLDSWPPWFEWQNRGRVGTYERQSPSSAPPRKSTRPLRLALLAPDIVDGDTGWTAAAMPHTIQLLRVSFTGTEYR